MPAVDAKHFLRDNLQSGSTSGRAQEKIFMFYHLPYFFSGVIIGLEVFYQCLEIIDVTQSI
jgi:hypothetical protein